MEFERRQTHECRTRGVELREHFDNVYLHGRFGAWRHPPGHGRPHADPACANERQWRRYDSCGFDQAPGLEQVALPGEQRCLRTRPGAKDGDRIAHDGHGDEISEPGGPPAGTAELAEEFPVRSEQAHGVALVIRDVQVPFTVCGHRGDAREHVVLIAINHADARHFLHAERHVLAGYVVDDDPDSRAVAHVDPTCTHAHTRIGTAAQDRHTEKHSRHRSYRPPPCRRPPLPPLPLPHPQTPPPPLPRSRASITACARSH